MEVKGPEEKVSQIQISALGLSKGQTHRTRHEHLALQLVVAIESKTALANQQIQSNVHLHRAEARSRKLFRPLQARELFRASPTVKTNNHYIAQPKNV